MSFMDDNIDHQIDLLDPDRHETTKHDFVLVFEMEEDPDIRTTLYVHKALIRSGRFACPMLIPTDDFKDRAQSIVRLPKPLYDVSQEFVQGIYTASIRVTLKNFPALFMLADLYTRPPNRNAVQYLKRECKAILDWSNAHVIYEATCAINGGDDVTTFIQECLSERALDLKVTDTIVSCGDLVFWAGVTRTIRRCCSHEQWYHLSSSGVAVEVIVHFVDRTKEMKDEQVLAYCSSQDLVEIVSDLYFMTIHDDIKPCFTLCEAISEVARVCNCNPIEILDATGSKETLISQICQKASYERIIALKNDINVQLWRHLNELFLKQTWAINDSLKKRNEQLTKTIDKCNKLFRKCKLAIVHQLTVTSCIPVYCRGEYIMRGWYNNGPVYMNKRHIVLDDRHVPGNKRYRVVIYRYRCKEDGSILTEDSNQLLDMRSAKKRSRPNVTVHEIKWYCWHVAMLRNECADPTQCACLLHSITNMVNNQPTAGDTLFFTCISGRGELPTIDSRFWQCEHETAKSEPTIESKSFLAVPTEFHRGMCE